MKPSRSEAMEMMQVHADAALARAAERKKEAPVTDRNCLTYWFPKLQATGLPVPRTEIVDAGDDWTDIFGVFDGPKHANFASGEARANAIADQLREAAARLGLPCPLFLRTGLFSGKHEFEKTCLIRDLDRLAENVKMLVYLSEMFASMGELPCRVWCVREMLPVQPVAILPGYGKMPLVPEVRCFVRGGDVVCAHSYWPVEAIRQGMDNGTPREAQELFDLLDMRGQQSVWLPLAKRAAVAFADDGAWSVDLLPTARGWFITDMAEAARSFHYDGCPHAEGLRA